MFPGYRIENWPRHERHFWRFEAAPFVIYTWTHQLFPVEIHFILANQTLIVSSTARAGKNVFWSSSKQTTSSPERASQCDGLILHRHVLEDGQQAGEELSSTCWIFLQLMQISGKSCAHDDDGLGTHELSVCVSAVEVRSCGASWLSPVEQTASKSARLRNEARLAFSALMLIFLDISHRHRQSPQAVIQLNYEETHYFFHMVSLMHVELDWKKHGAAIELLLWWLGEITGRLR